MEVVIEGEDAPDVTRHLRDWLRKERLDGLEADLAPGKPVPGTQGIEPITTILLFLKTKVATELVSSIKTWLQVRKPRVKLTFKSGKRQITLDAENTVIDEKLISNLKALLEEAS